MYQTVELSYDEKVKMYNVISKEKLIEMIIEANRHLDNIKPSVKLILPVVVRQSEQLKEKYPQDFINFINKKTKQIPKTTITFLYKNNEWDIDGLFHKWNNSLKSDL